MDIKLNRTKLGSNSVANIVHKYVKKSKNLKVTNTLIFTEKKKRIKRITSIKRMNQDRKIAKKVIL